MLAKIFLLRLKTTRIKRIETETIYFFFWNRDNINKLLEIAKWIKEQKLTVGRPEG